jgi:hypothetical protein
MKRLLLLALTMLVSACHNDPASPAESDYRVAAARWQRMRPAGNSYRIDQQVSCFCIWGGNVYEVTVTNGVVTRAVDKQSSAVVATAELGRFRTIDQLFADVASALQVPGALRGASYDPQLGYPSSVSLDPIRNAADDEVLYFTSRFVASGT